MLIGAITITISLLLAFILRDTWLPRRTARPPASPFHCVSIESTTGCCGVCESIRGRRFLVKQAPPLPLVECTAAKCVCRYVHYGDRRSGRLRRLHDRGGTQRDLVSTDRRLKRDRRRSRPKALAAT